MRLHCRMGDPHDFLDMMLRSFQATMLVLDDHHLNDSCVVGLSWYGVVGKTSSLIYIPQLSD